MRNWTWAPEVSVFIVQTNAALRTLCIYLLQRVSAVYFGCFLGKITAT